MMVARRQLSQRLPLRGSCASSGSSRGPPTTTETRRDAASVVMTKVMMQKSTTYTKAQESTRLHSPDFWEDKAMTGRGTELGGKRLRSVLTTLSAGALIVGLLAPAVALANPITISKTHRCDSNPFASAD